MSLLHSGQYQTPIYVYVNIVYVVRNPFLLKSDKNPFFFVTLEMIVSLSYPNSNPFSHYNLNLLLMQLCYS